MAEDIPYDKSFSGSPGAVVTLSETVRRVTAPNPGPFTFHGTNTYILGRGAVAIVDPGPEDEAHVQAILDAVKGETIADIFVTHTHRDHSPAARALKAATGATVWAEGPHRAARPLRLGETARLEASNDIDFAPDIALRHGDTVEGRGWTVEAVATPGHTANHMAFAVKETGEMFIGDHVMAWATSVVAPPDGAMADYMASLRRLARRGDKTYYPGHGNAISEPRRFVDGYMRHRRARERSILKRLQKGAADIPTIVRAIYIGLDPRLTGAAGLSVLAHLEDLVARQKVTTDGEAAIDGVYRVA